MYLMFCNLPNIYFVHCSGCYVYAVVKTCLFYYFFDYILLRKCQYFIGYQYAFGILRGLFCKIFFYCLRCIDKFGFGQIRKHTSHLAQQYPVKNLLRGQVKLHIKQPFKNRSVKIIVVFCYTYFGYWALILAMVNSFCCIMLLYLFAKLMKSEE